MGDGKMYFLFHFTFSILHFPFPMTPYHSQSKKTSGVIAFEIRTDAIVVKFQEHTYLYTYKSAGKSTIERMKKYALAQKGLSTFISQHQPAYEMKY
jgi:hypothetical protein